MKNKFLIALLNMVLKQLNPREVMNSFVMYIYNICKNDTHKWNDELAEIMLNAWIAFRDYIPTDIQIKGDNVRMAR